MTPARLRGIPIFEKLDEAALAEFSAQFVTERFEAGSTVIREGEPGDKLYVIVRGKVSVTATSPDQQPVQINVLQDGDYFGEIALLKECCRTATVRTLLPGLFLTLERKHFANMLAHYPAIREIVEQSTRQRLDNQSEWQPPGP